jgi:anthranilate phosphoribosyltransferase
VAEANMGFCLAARFHPAFRYTAPSRREIGISTAFNLLGPMANPAAIGSMLVGVAVPWMMRPMIEALGSRGVRSAWVVHGHGGVDEITLAGPCRVLALSGGDITEFTVDASDVGLEHAPLEAIKGGDARENAEIARAILGGAQGPMRDTVVLNAAAALHLAGVAPDLRHGRMLAEQSIDSGAARGVLDRLVQSSNRAAKRLDQ